jgi:hypothetical protein
MKLDPRLGDSGARRVEMWKLSEKQASVWNRIAAEVEAINPEAIEKPTKRQHVEEAIRDIREILSRQGKFRELAIPADLSFQMLLDNKRRLDMVLSR